MTIDITLPTDSAAWMSVAHLPSGEHIQLSSAEAQSTEREHGLEQIEHPVLRAIAEQSSWSVVPHNLSTRQPLEPTVLKHRQATAVDNLVASSNEGTAIKIKLFAMGDWQTGKTALLKAMMAQFNSHCAAENPNFSTEKHVCAVTLNQRDVSTSSAPSSRRSSGLRKSFSRLSRRSSKRASTASAYDESRSLPKYAVELIEDSQDDAFQRHLRPSLMASGRVHIFLLCFAVDATETLEHVQSRWLKEVRQVQATSRVHGVPEPVVVLVGTKADLRSNQDNQAVLMDYSQALPTAQALAIAKSLRLPYYEVGRETEPEAAAELPTSSSAMAQQVAEARRLIDESPPWMTGAAMAEDGDDMATVVRPAKLLKAVVAQYHNSTRQ
eukprot:TRINITY_DN8140_c0_g2_i2.p2 TRINITY_DN8140_c0_g2~~TRINITY_DN8140_c0_g2_i2.p2  ORF type:complete len:382 (+),score=85.35 TRINITY_DN8140_c0_g2_i2:203-1348(+)